MGLHGDLIPTEDGIKTCDLYLASFFVSVDCPVKKTQREGRKVYFCFENSQMMEDLKVSFFTRQAKVDAQTYADNIKALKSLCVSIVSQDLPRG